MAYADRVQTLANNSFQAKQIKSAGLQESFFSYITIEKKINDTINIVLVIKPIHVPYIIKTNNKEKP